MMMPNKFKNVPIDEDTTILFQKEKKLGKYHVLHERWNWDGVNAESIIFANEDITNIDDNVIKKEVKASELFKADSILNIKRTESGFTFVNFNADLEL